MSWIRAIAVELFGLFVDDGIFAASVIAWLLAAWLVLPRLGMPATATPIILFVGLALILLESAVRRARR